MRKKLITCLLLLSGVSGFSQTGAKVLMSDSKYSLEITPYSPVNKGALVQPIDRVDNKGISTSFFLHDTSMWKFYTNSSQRLTIGGNGNIITHTPLLVNNAQPDPRAALRINGNVRIDSALTLMKANDSISFISFDRGLKTVWDNPVGDPYSPYTATPTAWAEQFGTDLPVFRMRHPNNVSSFAGANVSTAKDFMIVPYQYGMAIEFNGVVECWVGEWSIHKGPFYKDAEGKGDGWGAVLWVGNDGDDGGVRATARNNTIVGGNVNYGELSVEKFGGAANGDFRLRLPAATNDFQFVYGERGSTNIVASLSDKGLVLPVAPATVLIAAPKKGQIVFDSTLNEFRGFDGSNWISLANGTKTGSISLSGTGNLTTFIIPHGLLKQPVYFNVLATSAAAAKIDYVSADITNLYIHYSVAPPAGFFNLSFNWEAKK